MESPAIQVNQLQKSYGDKAALNGISFDVRRGEVFGLLGPNGAGKTTALESLEGLRSPDSGSLRVLDVDPVRQPRRLRDIIGVQLQSSALPNNITVREAMRFFCAYYRVDPRYDLLQRMGLDDQYETQYEELSTGLQRRLALSLAVAHDPPILFLDEPTAGLDVPSRVQLHDLIRELREGGTTVMLATHDMAEAEDLSDRVAILLRGELVATGTPLELTSTGAGLTKISVRTANSIFSTNDHRIPAISHWVSKDPYEVFFSSDIGPSVQAIIEHIEAEGDKLIDLRVERPSLEDRFLEIAGEGGTR